MAESAPLLNKIVSPFSLYTMIDMILRVGSNGKMPLIQKTIGSEKVFT